MLCCLSLPLPVHLERRLEQSLCDARPWSETQLHGAALLAVPSYLTHLPDSGSDGDEAPPLPSGQMIIPVRKIRHKPIQPAIMRYKH